MKITLHPTRLRTAVALGALCLSGAAARPAIAADPGASWTVKPAAGSFGPDRKEYGYTLSPGGRLEDGMVIANHGATTLRLALRTADAVTTPAGRVGLVDRGARSGGVAAWVHLTRAVVTVEPGATVEVPFTITPAKNAGAGDHVGGIVTSPVGSAAADVGDGAERRSSLQIRLRVSGPLEPKLAVDDVHVSYSDTANPLGRGDATVTYAIRNAGNVILTARQAVSASGPLGAWERRAGRIADSPPLLPGSTWTVSAPLRDVVPALRLKVRVSVVPLLADAAGSIAPLPATTGTGHALAVPWTLLFVLGVVAGLAVVALRRRRRQRVGAARRVNGAMA